MTTKEIKEMTNEQLIANMFYMGVAVANEKKPAKKREVTIARICKELEKRNIIEDANALYEKTFK